MRLPISIHSKSPDKPTARAVRQAEMFFTEHPYQECETEVLLVRQRARHEETMLAQYDCLARSRVLSPSHTLVRHAQSAEDVYQACLIGIVRACRTWDAQKAGFSTHCHWRIICEHTHMMRKADPLGSQAERMKKVAQAVTVLENRHEPTSLESLSAETGFAPSLVKLYLRYLVQARHPSIQGPTMITPDGTMDRAVLCTVYSNDLNKTTTGAGAAFLQAEQAPLLTELIASLPHDLAVIAFGTVVYDLKHAQVAERLGVTREAVRRRQARAMRMLRAKAQGWLGYTVPADARLRKPLAASVYVSKKERRLTATLGSGARQ